MKIEDGSYQRASFSASQRSTARYVLTWSPGSPSQLHDFLDFISSLQSQEISSFAAISNLKHHFVTFVWRIHLQSLLDAPQFCCMPVCIPKHHYQLNSIHHIHTHNCVCTAETPASLAFSPAGTLMHKSTAAAQMDSALTLLAPGYISNFLLSSKFSGDSSIQSRIQKTAYCKQMLDRTCHAPVHYFFTRMSPDQYMRHLSYLLRLHLLRRHPRRETTEIVPYLSFICGSVQPSRVRHLQASPLLHISPQTCTKILLRTSCLGWPFQQNLHRWKVQSHTKINCNLPADQSVDIEVCAW